ncbi:hypothetical protein PPERSA_05108 [Pseudocohnilembus persalinus]|uniref:CSC1/OSCA1-like cytosolic domain-containing protein n=1 Tax=Pseudocohnilembus persalinus TaxID=266149 RepID=A0A0V0QVZ3_PSEPJ|nr:hypothetical protein PPERSA_05108 [Pseudocohnilembus persalinus]|eukprot:KRX06495.1 hypothetical protein PPERSA_05108 [Pseudocohnilembus persalinus]
MSNTSLTEPFLRRNISSTRAEIHQQILKNNESCKSLNKDEFYNPFQQPASFEKANIHRQSRNCLYGKCLCVLQQLHRQKSIRTLLSRKRIIISWIRVQVKNIPCDTSKQEIIEYFEDVTQQKIAKINLAYNIEDYTWAFQDKIVQLRQLKILEYELEKNQNLTQQQRDNLDQQIIDIKNLLMVRDNQLFQFQEECNNPKTSTFCGTAFITFEKAQAARDLVKKWGQSFIREAKFLFLNVALASPYLQFQGQSLIISQAMPPTDILWENLKYRKIKTIINNTIFFFGGLGILICSFIVQYLVMAYVYPLKQEYSHKVNDYYVKVQAFLLTIVVVTVNFCLKSLVQRFTMLMQFDSIARSYGAFINRYIILHFANSAFLPYLVHSHFDTADETRELLVQDIHFILLATAFTTPLSKIFDIQYFLKIFQRRKLLRYPEKDNPYTQHEANQIMEDYTINIVNSYTYIQICLFLSAWYGSVAPIGLLLIVLGMTLNYWVDKIQMLRFQAQPESINEKIIKRVVGIIEIIPILYLTGNYVYEYRMILGSDYIQFFKDFIGYGLTQIILSLSFIGFLIFYRTQQFNKNDEDKGYSFMRPFFRTEYDAVNPITQRQAQLEWIRFLRKQKLITKDEKKTLIQQNIKMSQMFNLPLQINQKTSTAFDLRQIGPSYSSGLLNQQQPYPNEFYDSHDIEEEDYVSNQENNNKFKEFYDESNKKSCKKLEYAHFDIDNYDEYNYNNSDYDDEQNLRQSFQKQQYKKASTKNDPDYQKESFPPFKQNNDDQIEYIELQDMPKQKQTIQKIQLNNKNDSCEKIQEYDSQYKGSDLSSNSGNNSLNKSQNQITYQTQNQNKNTNTNIFVKPQQNNGNNLAEQKNIPNNSFNNLKKSQRSSKINDEISKQIKMHLQIKDKELQEKFGKNN